MEDDMDLDYDDGELESSGGDYDLVEFAKDVGPAAATGGVIGSLALGPAGAGILGGMLGGTSGYTAKELLSGNVNLNEKTAKEIAGFNGGAAGTGAVAQYLSDNYDQIEGMLEGAAESTQETGAEAYDLAADMAGQAGSAAVSAGADIVATLASQGPEGAALGLGGIAGAFGVYKAADEYLLEDEEAPKNL